jgi:hypothetical protein
VPLAWPLSTDYVGISLAGHSPPVTAFLWTACLLALRRGGDQRLAELVPT